MNVNIATPIKNSAKDIVKFFFKENYNDRVYTGLKNSLLKHIDDCEIKAFANKKGSKITIKQKSPKLGFNPLDN